jgi:hypothetical protein
VLCAVETKLEKGLVRPGLGLGLGLGKGLVRPGAVGASEGSATVDGAGDAWWRLGHEQDVLVRQSRSKLSWKMFKSLLFEHL